jgi:L,D-peptidoglycan transpeptidase YkuD (ErfK/YbiS/YcfS/YnhG family)
MDRRLVGSAILLVFATCVANVPPTAAGAATPTSPATATHQARRDVAFTPDAQCDLATAVRLASRHPAARQFVIVAAESSTATTATLQIVARSSAGVWKCQQAPVEARLGKSGSRPLVDRRSGDGTTPAGVFPLGSVPAWDGQQFQFFGNRADPGVRGPYRLVRNEDCWGATPNTAAYQALVNHPGCTSPDEWLTRIGDVYESAAVIGANLDPISGNAPGEPALAAAIFLHRNSYSAAGASKPTSGCVSLAEVDLLVALRLIDPGLGVQFAIGELSWLRDTA